MAKLSDLEQVFGMVGAADEGAARHLRKTDFQGNPLPIVKLFGRHIAFHGEVEGGRLEVLAEGEHAAACIEEVFDRTADFGLCFSKAEHETGFYGNRGRGSFCLR